MQERTPIHYSSTSKNFNKLLSNPLWASLTHLLPPITALVISTTTQSHQTEAIIFSNPFIWTPSCPISTPLSYTIIFLHYLFASTWLSLVVRPTTQNRTLLFRPSMSNWSSLHAPNVKVMKNKLLHVILHHQTLENDNQHHLHEVAWFSKYFSH